jgi:hypothetical protein
MRPGCRAKGRIYARRAGSATGKASAPRGFSEDPARHGRPMAGRPARHAANSHADCGLTRASASGRSASGRARASGDGPWWRSARPSCQARHRRRACPFRTRHCKYCSGRHGRTVVIRAFSRRNRQSCARRDSASRLRYARLVGRSLASILADAGRPGTSGVDRALRSTADRCDDLTDTHVLCAIRGRPPQCPPAGVRHSRGEDAIARRVGLATPSDAATDVGCVHNVVAAAGRAPSSSSGCRRARPCCSCASLTSSAARVRVHAERRAP